MGKLHRQYGVKNVEEMEARYEDGTLEEADSWQDLQRLDHLEYEQAQALQLPLPKKHALTKEGAHRKEQQLNDGQVSPF